jgi:cytochrome c551/c552
MLRFKVAAVLALALVPATLAMASSSPGEALATAKHCFSCHDVKTKKFAPSFTDISHRFRGLENSKMMLARVVQSGTDGQSVAFHWGASTMPPDNVREPVTEAEAQILVDYILKLP